MSLFSSIQLANNALQAQQIGLQVTGQNIANANTPGYSREEALLQPAPTQRSGNLLLGLGVQVQGVVQKIDQFLEERLRGASSDRSSSSVEEETWRQLEGVLGELSDTDLSTSMTSFFSSITEVLNQPDSTSVRNLAVLKGQTLASDISRLADRVRQIRSGLNDRVASAADDVNRLLEQVRGLNIRIAAAEGGGSSGSDAVGLRDQRDAALGKLSELIDIRVDEQKSSATNIYSNGEFLLFEGTRRHVEAAYHDDRGLQAAEIRISETDSILGASSGSIAGLISARDDVLGNFLDKLDQFSQQLSFEFNKVFSSGQGLTGYDSLTSEQPVLDASKPLDSAGLPNTPNSGKFQVKVFNKQTGLTQSTDIQIDLDGLDDNDTTFNSLIAQLDAVNGLSATAAADGKITLASEASNLQFAFAGDTSGVLAALGINTFFTGVSAATLGVNSQIRDDPAKFAASRGGIGADTDGAVEMAGFLDRKLASAGGATISDLYSRLAGEVTQGSSVAHSVAQGFSVFEATLKGQQTATSGVSLDEEAVKLMTYQRAYQASAKYIATLNELLDELVKL